MTYQNDTMNDGYSGNLRVASAAPKPVSGLAAGPFDLSSAEREKQATRLSDALITGLLIVYPAFATAVAVVVGLFLSAPVA
jgi:hypothetical protein